jgi:hypothetical protein
VQCKIALRKLWNIPIIRMGYRTIAVLITGLIWHKTACDQIIGFKHAARKRAG